MICTPQTQIKRKFSALKKLEFDHPGNAMMCHSERRERKKPKLFEPTFAAASPKSRANGLRTKATTNQRSPGTAKRLKAAKDDALLEEVELSVHNQENCYPQMLDIITKCEFATAPSPEPTIESPTCDGYIPSAFKGLFALASNDVYEPKLIINATALHPAQESMLQNVLLSSGAECDSFILKARTQLRMNRCLSVNIIKHACRLLAKNAGSSDTKMCQLREVLSCAVRRLPVEHLESFVRSNELFADLLRFVRELTRQKGNPSPHGFFVPFLIDLCKLYDHQAGEGTCVRNLVAASKIQEDDLGFAIIELMNIYSDAESRSAGCLSDSAWLTLHQLITRSCWKSERFRRTWQRQWEKVSDLRLKLQLLQSEDSLFAAQMTDCMINDKFFSIDDSEDGFPTWEKLANLYHNHGSYFTVIQQDLNKLHGSDFREQIDLLLLMVMLVRHLTISEFRQRNAGIEMEFEKDKNKGKVVVKDMMTAILQKLQILEQKNTRKIHSLPPSLSDFIKIVRLVKETLNE
eukprot:768595-Hanusia_phi.AAC.5